MRIRMTVTVEIEDPRIFSLDGEGWPVGDPMGTLEREDVGQYVTDAVSCWGGQFAPGDVLFSQNIKSVRVSGKGFDLLNSR